MKKVLFIYNGITKNNGQIGISGGDERLFEIIKYSKDIDPYILTTPNGKELADKLAVTYKKAYVLDSQVDSGIISNLVVSLKAFFNLPKELKDYSGLVYSSCEHLYDVLPALRLKLFNKCTWYAAYHWVEDAPWKEKRGGTPFLKRYLYWINRWFSGFLIKTFADTILAVSDQTKEKLRTIKKVSPQKLKAVYCGVEFHKITTIINKYKKEKGKTYDAVFMKRLNPGKGIYDLLDIWKLVVEKKPDATLAIVGDGPNEVVQNIEDYIKIHSLEKNIKLLGVIYDFEEKFRILNSAKVFVLPSHEENWAIVIGEAIASRVPVLAYELKEIKPIWTDNIQWISFGDKKEFAEQVLFYSNNEKRREQLSDQAVDFIKKYDWQKIAYSELR